MFIKKKVDKKFYDNKGYVILDIDLKNNRSFNNLVDKINKI
tara:strand:+ start:1586 stop:1708 length:123 start_codon:yes stop_codon:yes gene_type:complete